jgi:uncharacterized protein (UPF0332 family)
LDEVELLIKKAELKLTSAKILFDNGLYEDAISRAYYCMYYSAKAILTLKGKYPRTHRGVISQFGLEFVKSGDIEYYYAKAFATAEERRERADYDIFYNPTKEEAEEIIEDAEKFLNRIKKAIETIKAKS